MEGCYDRIDDTHYYKRKHAQYYRHAAENPTTSQLLRWCKRTKHTIQDMERKMEAALEEGEASDLLVADSTEEQEIE